MKMKPLNHSKRSGALAWPARLSLFVGLAVAALVCATSQSTLAQLPSLPGSPSILNAKISASGTTMNITVQGFPQGPLAVKFNGVTLSATYNFAAGTIVATLPAVQSPGTYLLSISKSGMTMASADVTIGAVGPQGLTGATGATGPQGLSITWRGPWNVSTPYAINDAVCFNGSSYIATAAGSGAEPDTSPGSWNMLASVGAQGAAGPQGVHGATGPAGPAGGGATLPNDNTAEGAGALVSLTSGDSNTANGYNALDSDTSGFANMADGAWALSSNTEGMQNTASGVSALRHNTSGNDNTAIGMAALMYSTGNNNTALGWQAGAVIGTGNNNIDIGNVGVAGESGIIRIGTAGTHTQTYLAGTVTIPVLRIVGGADVAEPFDISTKEIPKGAVVVIDDENPGLLKMSARCYDKRVAGIVSGANGVNPGLTLRQEGVAEGGQNVALSGRVYALADASNGPVKPGDLLTTSANPGYCMRVTDHARAQGAVIGKAMSSLPAGKGLVLVLVTLQ